MTQPKKILLVDDDTDLRESLKTVLELSGYSVLAASDGAWLRRKPGGACRHPWTSTRLQVNRLTAPGNRIRPPSGTS